MTDLWLVLTQFVFRLTFGVALAMGVTPSKLVTSGFYRVHLWVLLGFNTVASLAIYTSRERYESTNASWQVVLGFAVAAAVLSYAGSVAWLYEQRKAGMLMIYLVALAAILAAGLATPWGKAAGQLELTLGLLDIASGGLLLGVTLAAMLLGHWYLNTPNMQLVPLRRLVLLMAAAIVVRSLLAVTGLSFYASGNVVLHAAFWIFISLRWLSGLLGTAALALMTWRTLDVPNTQSATGILYACVILAFIGELTSQLLSVNTLYPL